MIEKIQQASKIEWMNIVVSQYKLVRYIAFIYRSKAQYIKGKNYNTNKIKLWIVLQLITILTTKTPPQTGSYISSIVSLKIIQLN